MTNATITDMAEYRETKLRKAGALLSLTDRQITTRIVVMEKVVDGTIVLDTVPNFIRDNIFPNGYDPVNHPEDNLSALRAEELRRGVESQ